MSNKPIKEVAYLAEIGMLLTLEPVKWKQCHDNPKLVRHFVKRIVDNTKGAADATIVEDILNALNRISSPNWTDDAQEDNWL